MAAAREPQTLSNPQTLAEEEHKNQALIPRESDQDQHRAEVHGEDQTAVHEPTVGFDAISGLDGEDLIFSDEAFASLPDFRCLSSPSSSPSPNTSASHPQKSLPTSTPSSSSSSSSTSSNWPFLRSPDAVPAGSLPVCSSEMSIQPQLSNPHPLDDTDVQLGSELLGGGVDGFDFSVPWDSADLFSLTLDESGACSDQTFNLDQLCPGFDETNNSGVGVEGEDKEESDDLAKFFLEWLKNNKDAISPSSSS